MNHRTRQIVTCFCIALCTRLILAVVFLIGSMVCAVLSSLPGFHFPLFTYCGLAILGSPLVLLFPYYGLCMFASALGPEFFLIGVPAEAIATMLYSYVLVVSWRAGTLRDAVVFLSIVHALAIIASSAAVCITMLSIGPP